MRCFLKLNGTQGMKYLLYKTTLKLSVLPAVPLVHMLYTEILIWFYFLFHTSVYFKYIVAVMTE